ncbi:hypothetical protein [Alkalihalobacterium chitinilyticum]|uniref:Zinc ribbon domain-containing protein n=1 Tax=Alkalihalobacterium chitinilyticum TaxID=2980103 RepID=A0ABT5VF89_9BACI|nr:hypothetical protein [Alkalihalobacterium chitinilyticum]MDE5414084.1 hypothetical protein [Alkalihalobacterium chitinilyticum]
MNCPQCGSIVENGSKFCTSCGCKLDTVVQTAATNDGTAPSSPTTSFQDNQYLQQGREVSKQYLGYALEVLKNPMGMGKTVNGGSYVNGIISIVLYSLLLPIYAYFLMKKVSQGFMPFSFSDIVIMPFITIAIFVIVLTAIMFGIVKLMKVEGSFKDVLARFGTFLVVPVTFLLVAIILVFLSVISFSLILVVLASASYLIAVISTIYSFKTENNGGLDAFYGSLLTYIAMALVAYMMAESVLNKLIDEISTFF